MVPNASSHLPCHVGPKISDVFDTSAYSSTLTINHLSNDASPISALQPLIFICYDGLKKNPSDMSSLEYNVLSSGVFNPAPHLRDTPGFMITHAITPRKMKKAATGLLQILADEIRYLTMVSILMGRGRGGGGVGAGGGGGGWGGCSRPTSHRRCPTTCHFCLSAGGRRG